MKEFSGQCLCGAIKFSFEGKPLAVTRCHCDHCKKQSGSLFSINAIVRDRDFKLIGKTKVFTDIGDSGSLVLRHFCPNCGSPVFATLESMPKKVVVKAGIISGTDDLRPTIEIYTANAIGWNPLLTDVKCYPYAPS